MSFLDLLGNIWIVNLERNPEKKEAMLAELKKLPTELQSKVKFFKAIDGEKITGNQYLENGEDITFNVVSEWREPYNGKQLTKGEVGCSLSHWRIWQMINESINEFTNEETQRYDIVMEDDVRFNDNFVTQIIFYLEGLCNLEEKPDLIYLYRKPYHKNSEEVFMENPKLLKAKYSHWTACYMISNIGCQKLLTSDFVNHIIPVDEFLPIMYQESHLSQYVKYYFKNDDGTNVQPLLAVSVDPFFMDIDDFAFEQSNTVRSTPYVSTDTDPTSHKLQVWGIGTHDTSGRQRFEEFCQVYGVDYRILGEGIEWKMDMSKGPGGGQKINILKNALQDELNNNDGEFPNEGKDLILVSDTYDVIVLTNPTTILQKYVDLINKYNNDDLVVFSAEKVCWPNRSLAPRYPYPSSDKGIKLPRFLNSGGFIGPKKEIWNLLKDDDISDMSDDQEYWTKKFLNLYQTHSNSIVLDYESTIFQTLNEAINDLTIDHGKSRIYNMVTNQKPCFLHGNGPKEIKLKLNWMENYLGNHWNQYYGFIDCYKFRPLRPMTNGKVRETHGSNDSVNNLPKIFVALFAHSSHKDLMSQPNKFTYPQENLVVINYTKDLNSKTGYQSINDFLESDCDYYFSWEANKSEITDPKFFEKMLPKAQAKGVIAPLFRNPENYWANFWGALDENGYYARSIDYFEIIEGEKAGIWNVPYITNCFLIRRDIIENVGNLYQTKESDDSDPDMTICANLRNKDVFMFVDNTETYGYLYEEEREYMTIFNYKKNKKAWEEKYLDPEFLEKKTKIPAKELCADAYLFQMFNKDFCDELIEVVEKYGNWSKGGEEIHEDPRIGNIENFPTQDIHLNQIGFEEVWVELIKDYFGPLASAIFSPYKTKGLNIAFVVRYCPEGQKELKDHHDASTYTLNLALNECGKDYEGGGCYFVRQKTYNLNQPVGSIAIHPGRLTHYHRGLPTTKGVRYILVSFIN